MQRDPINPQSTVRNPKSSERKLSGSFYTPDFIVEYIVGQTLDPILDARAPRFGAALDRIAGLRQKLRSALDTTTNQRLQAQLTEAERDALDAFLGLKVCDSAMGSGHFLVNAVDHLTDGIIRRMQVYHDTHPDVAWEWNPVQRLIERMRREILAEMARQGIAIDPARLDDTALLTRLVMKRCIYGVDLNPLAVELAKLSLWLHSFTIGAPLSFLDHHLRWGNSVIGADVRTVERAMKVTDAGQFALFQGPFAGLTGLAIIRDIVAGERDPHKLAQHREPHCRKSAAEIAASLTGNYKTEHLFVLKQALAAHDFYQEQLAACDAETERLYQALDAQVDPGAQPLPPARRPHSRRRNEPRFDLRTELYRMAGVDLTTVDGLDVLTVQAVLTETGVDMTPWRTSKHFASWLSLCPENAKTGGKIIKRGTKPSTNRAALALRLAARSLHHSDSTLGACYRRMCSKLGKPQAVTATAHKLARIIYAMLKSNQPYKDPGADHREAQVQERKLKDLKRKAKDLGYELTPLATA